MKRGITVLVCVSLLTAGVYFAISKWGIQHETLNLFDASRQRPVSVDLAVRRDYEMKAEDGFWKLPVAIISNGNTVKNTEYSFLANVLAARGYLVASIQQDLPTDPPLMTIAGQALCRPAQSVYKKGEANILFVLGELKSRYPNADYDHLTLVGHSNGGDTAMYFAMEHPDMVTKVVTLDNLRVPFVTRRQDEDPVVPLQRPEFQDRSRRAAERTAGRQGRHQHHQDAVPAHRNERPRPGLRQGEDPVDARSIPGRQLLQRIVAEQHRQSADLQAAGAEPSAPAAPAPAPAAAPPVAANPATPASNSIDRVLKCSSIPCDYAERPSGRSSGRSAGLTIS